MEAINFEVNLKKLIAETREIAEALDEFADKLEKIEKGVEKSMSFAVEKETNPLQYLHDNIPHFMTELTEDDLDESEDEE